MGIIFYPTCAETKVSWIISLMCMISWIMFLRPFSNLPLVITIVSYVHGGYLPNSTPTIRQRGKGKFPVTSIQRFCPLRLLLSWLTTTVGYI